MSAPGVRRATRNAGALVIYRGLLTIALLVAAYHAFPAYKIFTTLSVIVFTQGLASIGISMRLFFEIQNHIDDLAERKTRHAILLARSEEIDASTFWIDVDKRVADEIGPDLAAPAWWAQAGKLALSFAGNLAADLVMVGIALGIS